MYVLGLLIELLFIETAGVLEAIDGVTIALGAWEF